MQQIETAMDEGTPLLQSTHVQDDFRGFMSTGEEKRRHSLARKTVFGEVRNVRRLRWVEWVFLVIATVTIIGLFGISVERLVGIRNAFDNFTDSSGSGMMYQTSDEVQAEFGWAGVDGNKSNGISDCNEWTCLNDFIFAVLLLVNLAFCTFYCYDGILRERPFEMVGFAVGISLITVYVIINYSLEGNQGDVTRLVRLVLVILMSPQNIVLAFVVQYRMGYLVLNTIGSNKTLTKAYHSRSLFVIIQRFNLQVLANILTLSWAKNGHFTSLGEKIVLPLLLVYMVMVSYLGWTAVIWELMALSIVWFFLVIPSAGFYVYKIVNVCVHWKEYQKTYTEFYVNGSPPDVTHFIIDASVILVLCAAGLLCVVATCVLMYITMKNFGKGLRDKLPPPCLKHINRGTRS